LNEEVYFQQRLDDQINWYSNKSSTNQKWYKRLKYLDNFLALIVVPLSYYSDSCWWFKYAGVAAGIVIAFSNFLQSINKYHENWIQYRSTAEILKHERYLYLTRSGGYANSPNAFNELVERCESIISSENIDWAQLHNSCPRN
jgi:hypothetical protein